MNTAEWQDFFDEQFPDGVTVTQIVDVEGGSDNYTFLSPRVKVLGVEDGDEPVIVLYPLNMQKDVRFRVSKLQSRPNGYRVENAEHTAPDFMLTKDFSENTAKELRKQRDQMIKQEKKYSDEED